MLPLIEILPNSRVEWIARAQPGGRGLRELKPPPPLARSKLRKKIRSFNF